MGRCFTFGAARALASVRLQCASKFRRLLSCLPFPKQKLFGPPQQLPCHRVPPKAAARSPGCRFLPFSRHHAPLRQESFVSDGMGVSYVSQPLILDQALIFGHHANLATYCLWIAVVVD